MDAERIRVSGKPYARERIGAGTGGRECGSAGVREL